MKQMRFLLSFSMPSAILLFSFVVNVFGADKKSSLFEGVWSIFSSESGHQEPFGAKQFLGCYPKVIFRADVSVDPCCLGNFPKEIFVLIFNDEDLSNNTRLAFRATNKAWNQILLVNIQRGMQDGVLCDLTPKSPSWSASAWEYAQSWWVQSSEQSVFEFKDENMKMFTNLIRESKSQIGGVFKIKNYDKRGFSRVLDILRVQRYVEVRNVDGDNVVAIGEGAIEALRDSLKQSTNLKYLNLNVVALFENDVKAIADLLNTSKTLIDIELNMVFKGNSIAIILSEALRNNISLKHIQLMHNNIGDEGVKALASALKNNTTLESLTLNHNGITDEGARVLREAMTLNGNVRVHLSSGNKIAISALDAIDTLNIERATMKNSIRKS